MPLSAFFIVLIEPHGSWLDFPATFSMKPPSLASVQPLWILFLVSFIEGGAVMAVELIGAKLVAPFYGNSLYVWAAVLGLTLGGLMAGYFAGGWLSKYHPYAGVLFLVMLSSALLVALMPWASYYVMTATLGLELRLGVTISCLAVLVPPLLCFGVVSPMIIRFISTQEGVIGHAAGLVYAISTAGGIVMTFLIGFYAIPMLGLKQSALATALLLAVCPVIFLLKDGVRSKGTKTVSGKGQKI